eukprot:s3531_g4.t1
MVESAKQNTDLKDLTIISFSGVGRLPDGDKGIDHLREIFHPKGFDDKDIVALSGAHTVGTSSLATLVPWNQIPRFVPGETDIRVYARKLEFLQALWPKEHLEHLGPRAALQVEGVGFQKISRLDPEKLRSSEGVAYLVGALGGQWGKLDVEDKLELFERALYLVHQKGDESHDSYLARHDAAFEDLLARKVSLEEVRAYILLRQSLLSSEDRKKVIMEESGKLTYENARKQIRLLGSKFFQDLQTGGGSKTSKLKTYDIHHVDDEASHSFEDEEEDEEALMAQLLEAGDEDACFVNDFEEQIMAACQESSELSQCFVTYQEARSRLKEKARVRGFWPLSGSGGGGKGRAHGKGFSGKGRSSSAGKMSWGTSGSFSGRRRSLADRIANSTCRKCGKPGHWKRECPMTQGSSTPSALAVRRSGDAESFTGMMAEDYEMIIAHGSSSSIVPADVVSELPDNARPYLIEGELEALVCQNCPKCLTGHQHGVSDENDGHDVFMSDGVLVSTDLSSMLIKRLTQCCRNTESKTAAAAAVPSKPVSDPVTFLPPSQTDSKAGDSVIFNTEEADDEAIIDTGASRAEQRKYLTRLLNAPEDTSLQISTNHGDMPKVLTRPPGVATLEEWGAIKAHAGKHQGKSFAQIYVDDRQYVNQIWNRRAVSSWIRSFQLYCRHRREASVEHQQAETRRQGLQMPINPHMMPEVSELIKKGGAPWLTPRSNAKAIQAKAMKDQQAALNTKTESPKISTEWQHVEPIEGKTNKRGPPASASSTMELQPDQDRVSQLQAQIAILQRDLQQELHGKVPPLENA